MLGDIKNLKLLSAYKGQAKNVSVIKERKSNGVLFRTKGSRTFEFSEGTVITAKPGELIFLPMGSSYISTNTSEESTEFMSINFDCEAIGSKPSLYSIENFIEKDYMLSHFVKLWTFGNESEKLKCYSLFYSLLSYISNIDNQKYAEKKKFKAIEKGVQYLQNHIYNSDLKTSYLAEVSGVSDTYFRKIFVSQFGITPQKYIVSKRLSHAKEILQSGKKQKISELAQSVGFSDPLYFSKVFKNKYGYSPSKA